MAMCLCIFAVFGVDFSFSESLNKSNPYLTKNELKNSHLPIDWETSLVGSCLQVKNDHNHLDKRSAQTH